MTYLPAPYEAAQQDDLAAALGAGLTAVTAGVTSWVLGQAAYKGIQEMVDLNDAKATMPPNLVVPTVGWSIAVLLMVVGALFLIFRRGRGMVAFGALVSVATTALAHYLYDWNSPGAPVEQALLYWGGVVVFVAAVLPATGRWVKRVPLPLPPGMQPPMSATATFYPST